MPLPKATEIGRKAFKDETKSTAFHHKKILAWIESKLVTRTHTYKPEVDLKTNTVRGYIAVEAPSEYYGYDGITKEKWKELFEAIIKPLGYRPVYTWDGGSRYDMVGIRWETKI